MRWQNFQCAVSVFRLTLEPLELLVQSGSNHDVSPLPGAPLYLVSLAPNKLSQRLELLSKEICK